MCKKIYGPEFSYNDKNLAVEVGFIAKGSLFFRSLPVVLLMRILYPSNIQSCMSNSSSLYIASSVISLQSSLSRSRIILGVAASILRICFCIAIFSGSGGLGRALFMGVEALDDDDASDECCVKLDLFIKRKVGSEGMAQLSN